MSYCTLNDFINRYGQTELIQLTNKDNTNTQALSLVGSATSAGTLSVNIGAQTISCAVNSGDIADTIIANLEEAFAAMAELPVTVVATGNILTMTSVFSGAAITFSISASVLDGTAQIPGLTISLVQAVNTTVLNAVLQDADAVMDSYLSDYLPLQVVPSNLVRLACEITRYFLYDMLAPDRVKDGYQYAIKFLEKVQQGKIALAPDVNGNVESQPQNLVSFQNNNGGGRFGRSDLDGLNALNQESLSGVFIYE